MFFKRRLLKSQKMHIIFLTSVFCRLPVAYCLWIQDLKDLKPLLATIWKEKSTPVNELPEKRSYHLELYPTLVEMTSAQQVDILLLGSGWTSKFLLPLLESEFISSASTTRSTPTTSTSYHLQLPDEPQDDAPESQETIQQISNALRSLPSAKMIVQIFPCKSRERVRNLVKAFQETHLNQRPDWVQLGSTGAWPAGE